LPDNPPVPVGPGNGNQPEPIDVEASTDPGGTQPGGNQPGVEPEGGLPPLPLPPADRVAVGKYTKLDSVLFRRTDDRNWSRVPALATVHVGDVLITPPSCHTQVTLDGGVIMELLGDTQIELAAPAMSGDPPVVKIAYGRVIVADARKPVVLEAGNQAFLISFDDAASGAAVEVHPLRTPGTNPAETASRMVVDVYAFKGATTLLMAGSDQPSVLEAPARRTLGFDEPVGEAALPGWIDKQDLSSAERLAHAAVEEGLRGEAGEFLVGGLLELADDRPRKRIEVRTLACRALMSIGRFDAAVAALGNSEFRASWPVLIEGLKLHVARDTRTAASLAGSLRMRFGEERSAELFRMLWGYSDEDLTGGEAERLVGYLDHSELEFRVLSSWNLRDVTGVSNVFYRADSPPVSRKQYVRQWRQRLESGQIVNKKAE
jgi:hypothetical protein